MDTQNSNRMMPARIAWPFIAVNGLVFILSIFNLVDHFQSRWSIWLSLALGAVDLYLVLTVFLWLKRRSD